MGKILRPGLVAIQYLGKIDSMFRGAVENRKYITVSPNDIVLVSLIDSITYCRGTQWKKIDTDVDITNMLNPPHTKEEVTLDNLMYSTDSQIKEACKKHGIKIGRGKIEDLVPLLLPFLNKSQD